MRALEERPHAAVDDEARPAHLRRALEIQKAEGHAELIVGSGREVEFRRFSPHQLLPVAGLVGTVGNALVRNVGNPQEPVPDLRVELAHAAVHFLDLFSNVTHLLLQHGRVLP